MKTGWVSSNDLVCPQCNDVKLSARDALWIQDTGMCVACAEKKVKELGVVETARRALRPRRTR